MDKKSILQAGHTPTLIAAFLYSDLAFMVGVLLGPLAVGIAAGLGLSHAEKGLMVATLVLAGALGMGNGAVFQLVPQRFRREIGVMTGLVGMAAGIGGFYLASSLGYSRQLTGSYQAGFLTVAALAVFASIGLTAVKKRWRTTWGAAHLTSAMI